MTPQELLALLTKANIDVNIGGLMPAEVANRFIDTTVAQSQILSMIRVERNIRRTRQLDQLSASNRLMRKAVEGTAASGSEIKAVTSTHRDLTPVEVDLPYNIGMQWLRSNIAEGNAEEQINALFAKQFSNDIVDLAVNADGTTPGFLAITTGWLARLDADSASHEVTRGATTDWLGTVFPALLEALPDKWQQDPTELAFFTSFQTEREYGDQLGQRNTNLGDLNVTSKPKQYYKGVLVQPTYSMPYGSIILTKRNNLAVGFGRDIESYSQMKPRDSIIEYTIKASLDANYAISDQCAWCV